MKRCIRVCLTGLLGALVVSAGFADAAVSGPAGPDYTLWTSTNLFNWQALLTTNSPLLPVILVDTNSSSDPARFYRVEIGP